MQQTTDGVKLMSEPVRQPQWCRETDNDAERMCPVGFTKLKTVLKLNFLY